MASTSGPRSSSSASTPSARPGRGRAPEELDRRPSVSGRRDPRKASYYRRMGALAALVVAALACAVVYVVVVYSPLFAIERITCNPTEHLTGEAISELAQVPAGSTLFGIDEEGIRERLESSPWVASVELRRVLPGELVIEVSERRAAAVVMLANGSEAWEVATDGCWLEPVDIEPATSDNGLPSPLDQARAAAAGQGLVFVTDVSALVRPVAGETCSDAGVSGVLAYLEGFSDALRSQIATAKAPSAAAISVVLTSGVEVSLGAPEDVAAKERVVLELLARYAGQVTYINVRSPSSPTLRALTADDGAADASGADGDGDDSAGSSEAASSPGIDAAGPGGSLDEGGYYADDGTWVYYYHDPDTGGLVYGYFGSDGGWVSLA